MPKIGVQTRQARVDTRGLSTMSFVACPESPGNSSSTISQKFLLEPWGIATDFIKILKSLLKSAFCQPIASCIQSESALVGLSHAQEER